MAPFYFRRDFPRFSWPALWCLLLPATGLLLSGCGGGKGIADLRKMPQDCEAYVNPAKADAPLIPMARQRALCDKFIAAHFAPWDRAEPARSRQDILNAAQAISRKPGFAMVGRRGYSHYEPLPADWLKEMLAAAGLDRYPNCRRKAVVVRNSDLRLLPTVEGRYEDIEEAGGGYPFDTLQESALWTQTPVFVSHLSTDGWWALVEAPFASGWMPVRDLAFVDDDFIRRYRQPRLAAVIQDKIDLPLPRNAQAGRAHIGAVFPMAGWKNDQIKVLAAAVHPDGGPRLIELLLPCTDVTPLPLPMTANNLCRIANQMLGQPYGWGGLDENRDCSATIRDLFTPFGLFLPRNSAQQARAGQYIDLEFMTPEDKERTIVTRGKPWLTLLRYPGHIILYLGTHKGRPALFQNFWGLPVALFDGTEGRHVVGRCCITSLQPGIELPNLLPRGDLRNRLTGMTLLAQEDEKQ